MNKKILFVLFCIVLLSLSGCKSTGFYLIPKDSKDVSYTKGDPIICGSSDLVDIAISPIKDIQDNRITQLSH